MGSQLETRAFVKATSSLITLNNATGSRQIKLPVTACKPALFSHWLSWGWWDDVAPGQRSGPFIGFSRSAYLKIKNTALWGSIVSVVSSDPGRWQSARGQPLENNKASQLDPSPGISYGTEKGPAETGKGPAFFFFYSRIRNQPAVLTK